MSIMLTILYIILFHNVVYLVILYQLFDNCISCEILYNVGYICLFYGMFCKSICILDHVAHISTAFFIVVLVGIL